jgi:hypothetical protein
MRRIGQGLTLVILAGLAWFVWQPPAPAPIPVAVYAPIPELPVGNPATQPSSAASPKNVVLQPPKLPQWRVVTRRIVWSAAVKTLEERLKEAELSPIKLKRKEPVIMHAFDDAALFRTAKAAEAARKKWLKAHIEATVIKANIEVNKDIYMVGLGRFFLTEYAEQIQNRLKQIGKPYRYERRTVTIPVYRFTFPARDKRKAEKLWQQLQDLGVATPVLMPEKEFQKAYGKG